MFDTMLKRHLIVALAAGVLILGGCIAPATREPRNIYLLKADISAYVDTGAYSQDIAAVVGQARTWIDQRAGQKKPGERLAIVLDIDETMISNLPLIRRLDYGYVPDTWNTWVASAQCPPIEPVRAAYQAALAKGISVMIITGRRERDRDGTVANLKAAGYPAYASISFKPDDSKETTASFKLSVRRRLAAEGYTLIANIGDQDSDFAGGGAERDFKLPDPFYLTK